jgi:cystathionine beta-lyase/cystathionine gamma-synthase
MNIELQTYKNRFRKCTSKYREWSKRIGFSSGLAATDCLMRGLKAGDEVIAMDDLYGGTYRLFTKIYIKIQV